MIEFRQEVVIMYNETVMSHFQSPQNVGAIPDASGVGEVGNVICGDILRVFVKIRDDRLDDVKYMTYGCAAAVASGSMMTTLARGMGGLPPEKVHCSNLAADALHRAIRDWQKKTGQLPEGYKEVEESHGHGDEDCCAMTE
jgi:nitrogen fixation NifU-like protein